MRAESLAASRRPEVSQAAAEPVAVASGAVCLTTPASLQALEAWWCARQDHPNNDLDQFLRVCALRPEVESPCVIAWGDARSPAAVLVCRIERTRFAPAIGYLHPVSVPVRVVTVLHRGDLGAMDATAAQRCLAVLQGMFGRGEVDALEFHHLQAGSALVDALGPRARWLRPSTHRAMALPASGSFLAECVSAKHRSRIRHKHKALERDFAGQVCWRWITEVEDVPTLCARIEQVAARTYQRGLGAGFFDNEEYRQRFESFARRGMLRVQLLEIAGEPRAFWFGIVCRGVFHSSETGYDPALRGYEVGTLVFGRLIDELIHEGVTELDFGLGDAPYKQRFGTRHWQETTAWLFAPTLKGAALKTLLWLASGIDTAARSLLGRAGLADRLKTVWRKRLASK